MNHLNDDNKSNDDDSNNALPAPVELGTCNAGLPTVICSEHPYRLFVKTSPRASFNDVSPHDCEAYHINRAYKDGLVI